MYKERFASILVSLAGCRRGFVFGRKRPFRRSFLAYIEASCPIFASKTSRFRGSLSLSDSLLALLISASSMALMLILTRP
jgi:hypothetical protein